MSNRKKLTVLLAMLAASPAVAQDAVTIDCTLAANVGAPECLSIPDVPAEATGFLPAAVPLLGLALVAAAGGGGGNGNGGGTPTTPTTPSTN